MVELAAELGANAKADAIAAANHILLRAPVPHQPAPSPLPVSESDDEEDVELSPHAWVLLLLLAGLLSTVTCLAYGAARRRQERRLLLALDFGGQLGTTPYMASEGLNAVVEEVSLRAAPVISPLQVIPVAERV